MGISPPDIHTLGAHHTRAGLVSKALRIATRPQPDHWTREPLDIDAALDIIAAWVRCLDLDVDALCAVPGHDDTPGPGHTLATAISEVTGIPIVDACRRRITTTPASSGHRHHWTHHAATMHAPSRHRRQRFAVVDNTVATGHSAHGTLAVLGGAGHTVTHLLAASHTEIFTNGARRVGR